MVLALDMCSLTCSKLTEKLEGGVLVWRVVPLVGIVLFLLSALVCSCF